MPQLKPVRGIQLNRSHPLARGLVFSSLFSESTGKIAWDSSGYGNRGILRGTAPSWSTGKFGSAILLPGTDEHIDLETFTVLDGVNEFTFSALVYKAVAGNFPAHDGLFARGSASQRTPWIWGFTGSQYLTCQFKTEIGGSDCNVNSDNLTANAWTHVVFIWDGRNCRFYLNTIASAPTDTTVGSTLIDTDGDNYIGRLVDFGYWNGKFDHVLIYKRALSVPFEIGLLNRKPFCMFEVAASPKVADVVVVSAARHSIGFKPIVGVDRLRGLRRSAIY